ncbi:MAG: hypothetical protein LUC43_05825, partial [Burkholderiales bacterium]|nr:hypothetical protein [Burkholderiales bacterium]
MQRLTKKIIGLLFVFCGLVACGFGALLLAYSIPADSMLANMEASAPVFEAEGSSQKIYFLGAKSQLDSFTDALMRLTASDRHNNSLVNKSLLANRPQIANQSPPETLSLIFSKDKSHVPLPIK